jgi:hypothetical protein
MTSCRPAFFFLCMHPALRCQGALCCVRMALKHCICHEGQQKARFGLPLFDESMGRAVWVENMFCSRMSDCARMAGKTHAGGAQPCA